jgi:hypothetical protein
MSSVPRWFAWLAWTTPSILALIPILIATAGLTRSLIAATVIAAFSAVVFGRRLWSMTARATLAGTPPGIGRLFAIGAPLLIGHVMASPPALASAGPAG